MCLFFKKCLQAWNHRHHHITKAFAACIFEIFHLLVHPSVIQYLPTWLPLHGHFLLYLILFFCFDYSKQTKQSKTKTKKSLFLGHRILFYNKYILLLIRNKLDKVEARHEKLCIFAFFSSLHKKIFPFRWSNSGWKTFMNFYMQGRKWMMWEKKQEREKCHLNRKNFKIQM